MRVSLLFGRHLAFCVLAARRFNASANRVLVIGWGAQSCRTKHIEITANTYGSTRWEINASHDYANAFQKKVFYYQRYIYIERISVRLSTRDKPKPNLPIG